MGYVDFKTLKAQVPILQAVTLLNIKGLSVEGQNGRGPCPICNAPGARNFVVNGEKNTWYCFAEKRGGDIIRLTACLLKLEDKAAAEHLAALVNGAGNAEGNPPAPSKASEPAAKPNGFDPLEYQKALQPDHPGLVPLGVSADTIRAFGGGFCTKGLLIGRLALPTYEGEKIAGFFGINIAVPHDLKAAKGCPDLFGTHIITDDTVRLVEHPLDVLRAYDNGITNVIAVLRPLNWEVLTSLAEWAKQKDIIIEL